MRKSVLGVSDQVCVQPQEMARGLKFCIKEVEGLYYPCSKNKGDDQLCGYRKADLRLCFRTAKLISAFVFAHAKNGFLTTQLKYLLFESTVIYNIYGIQVFLKRSYNS